jgi:hypothetical protein
LSVFETVKSSELLGVGAVKKKGMLMLLTWLFSFVPDLFVLENYEPASNTRKH